MPAARKKHTFLPVGTKEDILAGNSPDCKAVAARMGVSVRTVQRLRKEGLPEGLNPSIKVVRKSKFHEIDQAIGADFDELRSIGASVYGHNISTNKPSHICLQLSCD